MVGVQNASRVEASERVFWTKRGRRFPKKRTK